MRKGGRNWKPFLMLDDAFRNLQLIPLLAAATVSDRQAVTHPPTSGGVHDHPVRPAPGTQRSGRACPTRVRRGPAAGRPNRWPWRAGRVWRAIAWIAAAIGVAASAMPAALLPEQPSREDAPLTRIDEIRRLPRDRAAAAPRVSVSGVCTYAAAGEVVIHDGKEGIWVSSCTSYTRGIIKDNSAFHALRPGELVSIDGRVDPGGYAPQILPESLRVTGTGPLPPPLRVPVERLLAGSEDGQWIEVEGVAQSVEHLADRTVCSLVVDGLPCLFALNGDHRRRMPDVIDARVRVRGNFAPDFNSRAEALSMKIVSSLPDAVQVLAPPPADPFSGTRVPLDALGAFSPDSRPFHRRVTSGTVTFVRPAEFFFINDGTANVRIDSAETSLTPGWRVDVAGFVDTRHHFAALHHAIIRKLGEAPLPAPVRVTPDLLMSSASRGHLTSSASEDFSGRLVTLRGRLRRIDWNTSSAPAAVWLEAGEHLFTARLPAAAGISEQVKDQWKQGAEVELTGACEIEFRSTQDPLGLYQPTGFHLWLRSLDDLRIVKQPPWWTPEKLVAALSGAVGALALIVGWNWTLRRRVRKQTAVIGRQLQQAAVQDERARIARDMHDEIGGKLARLSLIGEIAVNELADHPAAGDKVRDITRGVREAAGGLEQIIWSVDPRHDTLEGVARRVCQFAEEYFADTPVHCHFGSLPDLPDVAVPPDDRANVMAVLREALANVLKHSAASHVTVTIHCPGREFSIQVADDGRGFDPQVASASSAAGGNGLANMRARLDKLGGTLHLETAPGSGARLTLQWNPFVRRPEPAA